VTDKFSLTVEWHTAAKNETPVYRERCSITVDNLTAELEEARLLAVKANRPSAAVRATIAKAKLHRLL